MFWNDCTTLLWILIWSFWGHVESQYVIFLGLEWPQIFCWTQLTYTSNFCFLVDALTVLYLLSRGGGGVGKCVSKENSMSYLDFGLRVCQQLSILIWLYLKDFFLYVIVLYMLKETIRLGIMLTIEINKWDSIFRLAQILQIF